MVDLTVPYESRMEEAHKCKIEKYLNLTKELFFFLLNLFHIVFAAFI